MRRALILALALGVGPVAAHARELWSTDDGKSALELRSFYKGYGGAMRLPDVPLLPRDAGISTHTARAWGRLLLFERWELQAGWKKEFSFGRK